MKENKPSSRLIYSIVKNRGKRFHFPLFSLIALKDNSALNIKKKYFIIISKKISKKAVVRNLLKRRIKYIINKNSLPADVFFILFTKSGVEKINFSELDNNLKPILQQIKNIK